MQRTLVTGASGFIGQQLSHKLIAMGCHVRGLDLRGHTSPRPAADPPSALNPQPSTPYASRLPLPCPPFQPSAFSLQPSPNIWPADITAPNLDPKIFEGIDTVFHLAGKVHSLAETRQDDAEYSRINTQGTKHVLEAAQRAGVRRLILFSTVKAMSNDSDARAGEPSNAGSSRAFTEEDQIEPDTAYGKSKLEAERLVLLGGYVAERVVLRLCLVYGPRAKGNIEKMIEAVRHHRFPPLPEMGNRRSMVHVQDVLQAAVLAGTHPKAAGQVFIVSDGQTYSTRQMYELICRALNRRVPGWTMPIGALRGMAVVGDLIGEARGRRFVFDSDALHKLIGSAWFSSRKIQTLLSFNPQWTLEQALPEMVSVPKDSR